MARQKDRLYLPDGTTKWVSGDTKQEFYNNVTMILAPMIMSEIIQSQQNMKGSKITLKEYIETVYKPTYLRALQDTTKETYRQYFELYIYRYLGSFLMTDIDVQIIQAFYNWMAEGSKHGMKNDLNADSISRVAGLLSRVFSIAVASKYIRESPMQVSLLRNPGKKATHHHALVPTAMNSVRTKIPYLEDEQARLFMALLAYTGMRPEEILGMRWEEVNLDEGYANMVRTVTYPRKIMPEVKEAGKTENSIRSIILVPAAVKILQSATKKAGYVVHGKDLNAPCPRTTYVKLYKKTFAELGIEEYSPYDFRSNFATECTEAGFTSKQVADMMGHADTRMVERVYSTKRKEGILQHRARLAELTEKYAEKTTESVTKKEASVR